MIENIKYRYCCVDSPNLKDLEHIIDNAIPISVNTFKKNIGTENYENLKQMLGYKKEYNLRLEDDYAVNFYKSRTIKNDRVYYCEHSRIEYIYY